MKNTQLEKRLRSQVAEIDAKCEALKIEVFNKQKELSEATKKKKDLLAKIAQLNVSEELRISEHAMLRYIERVKGVNVETLESEIITRSLKDMVSVVGGSGTFPVNGFKVVIKDNVIVTIC